MFLYVLSLFTLNKPEMTIMINMRFFNFYGLCISHFVIGFHKQPCDDRLRLTGYKFIYSLTQKKSRNESHGTDSGVEIMENKPYKDGPGGDGQYTYKIYHIGSHLPG